MIWYSIENEIISRKASAKKYGFSSFPCLISIWQIYLLFIITSPLSVFFKDDAPTVRTAVVEKLENDYGWGVLLFLPKYQTVKDIRLHLYIFIMSL